MYIKIIGVNKNNVLTSFKFDKCKILKKFSNNRVIVYIKSKMKKNLIKLIV